jgi:hypothetical protein
MKTCLSALPRGRLPTTALEVMRSLSLRALQACMLLTAQARVQQERASSARRCPGTARHAVASSVRPRPRARHPADALPRRAAAQAVMSPPPPPPAQAGSRVQVLVNLAAGTSASAVTAMQQELQAAVSSGQLADSLRVAGALAAPEDMRRQPQRACHGESCVDGTPAAAYSQRDRISLAVIEAPCKVYLLKRKYDSLQVAGALAAPEGLLTACASPVRWQPCRQPVGRRCAGSPTGPAHRLCVGGALGWGGLPSVGRQNCGFQGVIIERRGLGTQARTAAACVHRQARWLCAWT